MIDKTDSITPGSGIRLRKTGNFDLNALYKDMRTWFNEKDYTFFEKENKKKDNEAGQFVSLKWEASRNIDDYAQFKIRVQFFIENLEPVKENGKKIHHGSLEIKFWADVILDYLDKWEQKPFGQFLFRLYNNMIIKSKIQNVYEDKLDSELKELINIAKSYL